MNLKSEIDKYFWQNEIGDRVYPGIFLFDEISEYIKYSVSNKINLGQEKFINDCFEKRKNEVEHFSNLIHQSTNVPKEKVLKHIKLRLIKTFRGLYGEAILENIYSKSKKYELIKVTSEEDYILRIDMKVKEIMTGRILNYQIKSSSFSRTPTTFTKTILEKEKKIHKEYGIKVVYVYYNHDFSERYFQFEDNIVSIYGYGNSNIKDIEEATDKLFKNHEQAFEKVTTETIIF